MMGRSKRRGDPNDGAIYTQTLACTRSHWHCKLTSQHDDSGSGSDSDLNEDWHSEIAELLCEPNTPNHRGPNKTRN